MVAVLIYTYLYIDKKFSVMIIRIKTFNIFPSEIH